MKRIEYAAAERDYESEALWTTDRLAAQWEVEHDRGAGVDSYLIERTVTVSRWRESKP